MPPASRIRIIIVTADLFFESRIMGAVQPSLAECRCVADWVDYQDQLADEIDQVIVVDLSVPNVDRIVNDCRSSPGRHYVIGFASHVHKARLEAALSAGFHEAISQGQVESRVRELVCEPIRIPFDDQTS